ncbi:MAG: SLOG family protein [Rikenellaceae bacterium]
MHFFFVAPNKANTLKIMHIINKEKTIAFTGNRNLTSPDGRPLNELKAAICNRLMELLEREYLDNGINTFISGMALGFDLLCATVVVELKRKYPEIRLVAALPFIEQADKYSEADKAQYRHLIDQADFTIAVGGYTHTNQAYHDRNDFMLTNASKIIAYHNGKARSGTGSTLRKAGEQCVEVVNLYADL